MFTGAVREYRKERANEEIGILVLNKASAEIWSNNPNIKHVYVSRNQANPRFWNPPAFWLADYWKIRKEALEIAKKENYGRIKIIKIQAIPEIFYRIFGFYGAHKVERMARELGVQSRNLSYEIFPSAGEKNEAEKMLGRLNLKNFVAVHPFSRDPLKNFTESDINSIINTLKKRKKEVLVVGSSDDKANFKLKGIKSIFGMNFGSLASILSRAKMFIGTDSAISHLAGTSGIPIIVISPRGAGFKFSHSGKPEWFLPYGRKAVHLLKDKLSKIEKYL
jgi:ADP-heptose:LPS heptosyltransferase